MFRALLLLLVGLCQQKILSVTALVLVMDYEIQKAGILCRGCQVDILELPLYNVEKCDFLLVV